jgi:hypothetical protein
MDNMMKTTAKYRVCLKIRNRKPLVGKHKNNRKQCKEQTLTTELRGLKEGTKLRLENSSQS